MRITCTLSFSATPTCLLSPVASGVLHVIACAYAAHRIQVYCSILVSPIVKRVDS